MTDTTNINELPVNPANGISGNVNFSANEIKMNTNESPNINALGLDQSTISQLISGLQQASSAGATQLQSRDIPQNTQGYTQDAYIQPNYIPPSSNNDYIKEYENTQRDDIVNSYNYKMDSHNSLDSLYDEIQIPLLIAILYFLFQLPIFKKFLFNYFPILFFKDGNINIYGYVFTSVLFGLIYYFLFKIMTHFSKF